MCQCLMFVLTKEVKNVSCLHLFKNMNITDLCDLCLRDPKVDVMNGEVLCRIIETF